MAEVNPGVTNLESWWTLNEESGQRNDSRGSNHLADINTVLFGAGKIGNAADFDNPGNNERLRVADNPSLSFADEGFTLGTWVKLESKTAAMRIMDKWEDGKKEYILRWNPNRFGFIISSNGVAAQEIIALSAGTPDTGTWYFLMCWHDPVANRIYIQVDNGVIDSVGYSDGCNDNTSGFTLGGAWNAGQLNGMLDESFIYRRVLDADNREFLYNSGAGRTYSNIALTPVVSALMHRRTRIPGQVQPF